MKLREDLEIIYNWVEDDSHVLDLGCGDGNLLYKLKVNKRVTGYGLEINTKNITACIEKGINVIEHDLNAGLQQFEDKSFDAVIMTQSLQAMRYPDIILKEILRIGRSCIITFPNFGHWYCRYHLSVKGKMPVSKFMPYDWYNTPNIHFCTIDDFDILCDTLKAKIVTKLAVDHEHQNNWLVTLMPNVFAKIAIYKLQAKC